jgi:hypothetical protein
MSIYSVCSICSVYADKDTHIDMYYSKLKQSNINNKYVCFKCYKQIETEEEQYIRSNINNINSIVKEKYIADYIEPEPKPEPKPKTKPTPKPTPKPTLETKQFNNDGNITIYKIIKKIINGVERDMVLIDLNDYRILTGDNRPITTLEEEKENRNFERLKKMEEHEIKNMQQMEEREKKYVSPETKAELKARKEIQLNASRNKIIRKQNDELLNDYKHIKDAKIKKCHFCEENKIFPVHYKDENNNPYLIEYVKDKEKNKSSGCVDCYNKSIEKKNNYILDHTVYCEICKCSYISLIEDVETNHLMSSKHKKNTELFKLEKQKKEEIKDIKIDLSKLSIKQLQLICSKSLNKDSSYLISGYTRLAKKELLIKMNENYNSLVFV